MVKYKDENTLSSIPAYLLETLVVTLPHLFQLWGVSALSPRALTVNPTPPKPSPFKRSGSMTTFCYN